MKKTTKADASKQALFKVSLRQISLWLSHTTVVLHQHFAFHLQNKDRNENNDEVICDLTQLLW